MTGGEPLLCSSYDESWLTGLALDIILCSPFWLLSDYFKSPKIKSISQIYNTKTTLIDVSHFVENLAFFQSTKPKFPEIYIHFMIHNYSPENSVLAILTTI